MSFDLYLQTFHDGKAAAISLDAVRDAFGKYVIEVDDDFWQVQYDVDESSDIFLQPLADDYSQIHTLSVHRPCRDARLWSSLWRLLELPGTIFYFPGCTAALARDLQSYAAMPPDMQESLGEPIIVNSALEISSAVEAG